MYNRMINHFAGDRKQVNKPERTEVLDTRYAQGLKKLYAYVYGG